MQDDAGTSSGMTQQEAADIMSRFYNEMPSTMNYSQEELGAMMQVEGEPRETRYIAPPLGAEDWEKELRMTAYNGDIERVRQILDMNVQQRAGRWDIREGASFVEERWNDARLSPLMLAALSGHSDVLSLLFTRRKTDVLKEREPDSGFTALCFAVLAGRSIATLVLLLHGAEANVESRSHGSLENILKMHSTLSILARGEGDTPENALQLSRDLDHLIKTAQRLQASRLPIEDESWTRLLRDSTAAERGLSVRYLISMGVPQTAGVYTLPHTGETSDEASIPIMLAMSTSDHDLALTLLVAAQRYLENGMISATTESRRNAYKLWFKKNVIEFVSGVDNIATNAVRILDPRILQEFIYAGGAPVIPGSSNPRSLILAAQRVYELEFGGENADNMEVVYYREMLEDIVRIVERYAQSRAL